MHTAPESSPPIRIGVSSCLLGQPVRFDAGHKRDPFLTDILSRYFAFVPVCPEVAIGLGIPRPPIRLEGDPEAPEAVGVRDKGIRVTAALAQYGRRMGEELADLSGYVLKSKSPSCGMERVKVYPSAGQPAVNRGVGVYVRAFRQVQPLLPMEEEGRLNDPVLRENFIQRVFSYRRWQDLAASGLSPQKLVGFHARHKLVLMAHSPVQYRALGRLVADAGARPLGALTGEYLEGFMTALKLIATRKKHANVLMHLLGYLKRAIDAEDKAELLELIDRYRNRQLPLIVPVTLLRHHFRRHPHPYVVDQVYLEPYPEELVLRNSI
jgi:uncharacterized protein YbgA (DUF1722 family)/uncharacterized protein YbbK (DUF523 family)